MKDKTMKGYLIDPEQRRITSVDVAEEWQAISELIGARYFCVGAYLSNEDTAYVDDEGLLNDGDKHWFKFKDSVVKTSNPNPLCGKCLVLGTDRSNGESIDVKLSFEELENAVSWVADDQVSDSQKNPTFEFLVFD